MYDDITGVILAGGKSSRMGVNKSLLKINDKTIIEKIVELMKSVFKKVIVITNTFQEYAFLKLPMFKDVYLGRGPLAGIHSGLIHSVSSQIFVISCDMPLITREMIEYIVNYKTEYPVTVCRADGFIQQLAGRYSKLILPKIESILVKNLTEERSEIKKKRKCNVLQLIENVGAEIINAESLEFYSDYLFFNMNNIEDYNFVSAQLKK